MAVSLHPQPPFIIGGASGDGNGADKEAKRPHDLLVGRASDLNFLLTECFVLGVSLVDDARHEQEPGTNGYNYKRQQTRMILES